MTSHRAHVVRGPRRLGVGFILGIRPTRRTLSAPGSMWQEDSAGLRLEVARREPGVR
jgi:hypothetical protein